MDVSLEVRRKLVEQLLSLNSTQSLEDRLRILQRMNANIAHRIPESSAARTHLNDIVERCSNVPGAIQSFIESVAEDELFARAFPAAVKTAVLVVAVAAARAELNESTSESTLRSGLPMSVKTDRSLSTLADQLTALWKSDNSPEPPIYAYLDWLGEQLPTAKTELVDLKVWTRGRLELSPNRGLADTHTTLASVPAQELPAENEPIPENRIDESGDSQTIEESAAAMPEPSSGAGDAIFRIVLILIVMATFYVTLEQPTNPLFRNVLVFSVGVLAIFGIGKQIGSGFRLVNAAGRILRDLVIGIVAGLVVYLWTTPDGWRRLSPIAPDAIGEPSTELIEVTQAVPTSIYTPASVAQNDISDRDAAIQLVLLYQTYLDAHDYEAAYSLLSDLFREDLCQTDKICDYVAYGAGFSKRVPPVDIPVDEIWDFRPGLADSSGVRFVFNARKYIEANGVRQELRPYRYCVLHADDSWLINGISSDLDSSFCD